MIERIKRMATKRNKGLLIRYFAFAAISTILNVGLLYILTEFAGIYYLLSAFISSTLSIFVNFLLNKYFNFRVAGDTFGQMKRFFMVAGVSILLNLVFLKILVDQLGIWYMYAILVTVFMVFVWSFYGHMRISFREPPKK